MPSVSFAVPGRLDQHTGGYIYDRRMIEGLQALGWDVHVLELDPSFPHPTAAALSDATGALARVPSGGIVVIDSLAFGAMPEVVGREASRLRLVALVHLPLSAGALIEGNPSLEIAKFEADALRCAACVVVTGMAALPLLARYDLPMERVVVIEPGTDPAPLAKGSRANEPLQLLCVATVNAIKGHERLLEALATMPHARWQLTCAGSLTRDPATVARTRAAIERLGLQDHVVLAGELSGDALEACFDRTDVFVLASRQETFGMAVAEAIAHGIPIVATDTGAVAALLADQAGLVVPVDDRPALASALARIVGDEDFRAEMAEGARHVRTRLRLWNQATTQMATTLDALAHG